MNTQNVGKLIIFHYDRKVAELRVYFAFTVLLTFMMVSPRACQVLRKGMNRRKTIGGMT